MSVTANDAALDTRRGVREVNFDGLVGPTHNYAGLAHGNVASMRHGGLASNPREAALQGLAKMKALADAGYAQAVLPPQQRPDLGALRDLGFTGSNAEVLERAAREAPQLLRAVCSASSMWTANAATITPSRDAADGRTHFTPANLQSSFHRFLEPQTTGRVLAAIFRDEVRFAHHPALPATPAFADEGAANHTRLAGAHGDAGVHLYVYGRQAFGGDAEREPKRFPARQTLEASQAVARQHGLSADQVVFAQQHPDAIDAGVFHNDVIAVGNGPVLLYHEMAFLDEERTLDELRRKMAAPLIPVRVPSEAVSLDDAVSTYLFNSQLLSDPDGSGAMTLVVPGECQENEAVWRTIQDLLLAGHNPINEVMVKDVKQSMRNGGGPACLRLRVPLSEVERAGLSGRVLFDEALYGALTGWVERHYRNSLTPADLADPQLADETLTALDELTRILEIGSVYPFQLEA
ncbi:N-succinylarginine dihydrolase [Halomonas sp. HP20-15]|uniref:N-succinylarginine dihydrolase n=1 Tax=Halomonas sp. HP20-15 TaxID=3085901 RepID=UPI002981E3CB|nr:N-succinylarginine dihydrolase [Halomonas sp. HP20-15]MDW5377648.1 N-succinylarginine dihydrolase [Halomonas sp. HP20-15]